MRGGSTSSSALHFTYALPGSANPDFDERHLETIERRTTTLRISISRSRQGDGTWGRPRVILRVVRDVEAVRRALDELERELEICR